MVATSKFDISQHRFTLKPSRLAHSLLSKCHCCVVSYLWKGPCDTEKNRSHIALWNNAKNRLDSECICVWTYIFSQKTLLCQGEALHIKADSWLTFWTKSKRICQAGISQWDSIISVSGKERHPPPSPTLRQHHRYVSGKEMQTVSEIAFDFIAFYDQEACTAMAGESFLCLWFC